MSGRLPRPPSNTYAVAVAGIVGVVVLAILASVLAGFGPRDSVRPICDLFADLGMTIGALGGLGSAALSARDVASGGLTSSSGHRVLEARKVAAGTTTIQAISTETTSTPTPTSTPPGDAG